MRQKTIKRYSRFRVKKHPKKTSGKNKGKKTLRRIGKWSENWFVGSILSRSVKVAGLKGSVIIMIQGDITFVGSVVKLWLNYGGLKMRKNKRIEFKVSTEEYERMCKQAQKEGYAHLSEWIRWVLLNREKILVSIDKRLI